jgi:hypothetical protein
MFSGKAGAFTVLCLGVVLVGSCFAEDGKISGKNTAMGSARPRIFQSDASSQKLQTAANDTRSGQVSGASIRAASAQELEDMEQTLDKYRTAFENLSLPQLRQVWPDLDHRRASALTDVFEYLRSSKATPQLGLECAPPKVIGDSAKVECRETLAYSDGKGKSKEVKPAIVSIQLKKQSDAWVVETMKGLGAAN